MDYSQITDQILIGTTPNRRDYELLRVQGVRLELAPTPPPEPTPCDPTLQECPSPTPLPEGVEVSSFRCLSVDLVGDALTANSLAVGAMTPPGLQGGRVVQAQSPEAGMFVPPGTSVDLVFAPRDKVPGCG